MTNKIHIKTDNGQIVEAIDPVIISASRSTDIPAFYAKWFINRLKKGYVIWYNPFNQQPLYVSFNRTKVVVFWTKNAGPLIPYLNELDELGIHYYFQFTLNNYEKEKFEPNVLPLYKRIEIFRKLSSLIGREKVIWRFDPIIITKDLTPKTLLTRIWNIGNEIKGFTDKLVFSFVDVKAYRKVQNNLVRETNSFTKEDVESAEPNEIQINELIGGLVKIRKAWAKEGWNLAMATCAEEIELEKYNIEHNRCVDGELLKRIFSDDTELVYYLNYGKFPEYTLFEEKTTLKLVNLKDKGQRKICGCLVSKDIGMYNTCFHLCSYCYANCSRNVVENSKALHNENSESLI